jgi:hypothetical protein
VQGFAGGRSASPPSRGTPLHEFLGVMLMSSLAHGRGAFRSDFVNYPQFTRLAVRISVQI